MFNKDDALMIAKKLGISFDKFSLDDFVVGLNIELEHGKVNFKTNVTDNDLEKTSKIVLAHLNEFPDYYNSSYGLPAFENMLRRRNRASHSG